MQFPRKWSRLLSYTHSRQSVATGAAQSTTEQNVSWAIPLKPISAHSTRTDRAKEQRPHCVWVMKSVLKSATGDIDLMFIAGLDCGCATDKRYINNISEKVAHTWVRKKSTLHCDVTLAKAATLVHKSVEAQRQQERNGKGGQQKVEGERGKSEQ